LSVYGVDFFKCQRAVILAISVVLGWVERNNPTIKAEKISSAYYDIKTEGYNGN